jgi:hypothetical protein
LDRISCKFAKKKLKNMQAAQATPAATSTSLEARKLNLIRQIAELEDEEAVLTMEEVLLDYISDYELSDEEKALIDERLAELRANPDDVIAWETLKQEFIRKK